MQAPVTGTNSLSAAGRAQFVRERIPAEGLFAGLDWRISPDPFPLGPKLVKELDSLGRVLLQFYRAVNLLYRKSAEGKQPAWIAQWLDMGKPSSLIELQRSVHFKNDVPRVIRPDLLITDTGVSVTELDSIPGGIGLTAWLNQVYSELGFPVLGGGRGMLDGFRSIFGSAHHIDIVVSDEAATYRPEMQWVARQPGFENTAVRDGHFHDFPDGAAVYRFFELFDLANVPNSSRIIEMAQAGRIQLTPPPKPVFEEKILFALLWNRNLHDFWRQELGQGFLERLQKMAPYSWVVDPSPLPPHGAIPGLSLTDWRQLKLLSHKERELILKISGFSAHAWGARGVSLGSDMSHSDWSEAVDKALSEYFHTPYVLQRFHKPGLVKSQWYDFARSQLNDMPGRVRLCPYYFVSGAGDAARAKLGGVLATICPADKKIIHGMSEAVLAPCIA
jgi:hypothetical protein